MTTPPPAPPRPDRPRPVPTTFTLNLTVSDSALRGDIIKRFSVLVADISETHKGHVIGVGFSENANK